MATLALAQDNAFGQPLESQLRSCLLASWLCESMKQPRALQETVYWVALLRYIGCTGHAHEVAALFGNEIAVRAQTLVHDAANPAEVVRDAITFATAGRSPEEREQIIQMIQREGRAWSIHNFASGCEVGDMLLQRLGLGADVRAALRFTFERWNGAGFPAGASGEAIPLAMRIVHLSHDMEAIGRLFSPAQAIQAATERRGRTYDPELVDAFVPHAERWFTDLAGLDPWDAVLDLEPRARRTLTGQELDAALTVAADFIDLKSPYTIGHSRRCADLSVESGRVLGMAEADLVQLRQAALLHDFGTTAVPNSIWDKPGSLTRAERDRVELHPLLTEQMLRRCPSLAALAPIAAAHHERCDGSGYHKRLRTRPDDRAAAVLAAADVYVALLAERADRAPSSPAAAAAEMSAQVKGGRLDPDVVRAVLQAAGHDAPAVAQRSHPAGLSSREVEVLRLAAKGLTIKDIAGRLFISPKTVDRHLQNLYGKIEVSTRAAAALWATQNGLVG